MALCGITSTVGTCGANHPGSQAALETATAAQSISIVEDHQDGHHDYLLFGGLVPIPGTIPMHVPLYQRSLGPKAMVCG